MTFPAFFAAIPPLRMRDPLAALLGAADDGLIDYRFADAVRLAGHSCPTVAGAWLLTVRALKVLYGNRIPERGGIAIALPERQEQGVAGVIGSVITLLTGAAGSGGFKGLAGRHGRRELLRFGVDGVQGIAFTRLDSGRSIECLLQLDSVPGDPRTPLLLQAILDGSADREETRLFGELWQARVRRLLVDHADDPALVDIRIRQE